MADLKISALNSLAGADLVAADVVAVVDDSASETKKLTVSDLIANGTTLISDATIPSAKILFAAGAIDTAELAASAVETAKINDSAVTAAKLADNSSVTLVSTLPASGDFVGQVALDTDDSKIYVWSGSAWTSVKGAGSINVVSGSTSGIVNITTSTSGDTVTISTTLDDTSSAKQFLAGPTGAGGTVGYRAIASGDLPTATSSAKGAVAVNGNGLTMSNDEIQIDNSVTAETTEHHLVQYDANGLITAGRVIAASDLPEATSSAKGAVVPGSGLEVASGGTLNHTNSTTAGTYTKVTVDAQGHVTSAVTLAAADIPDLDAAKITTGTFPTARLADDAVTAAKLADQSVAKFGGAGATDNVVTFPDGDFKGQFFFDEKNEDLYIYTGESFLPITVISGNLVNAGTYDASTNLLSSVTTAGSAAGFTNGAALPAPASGNLNYYVVVDTSGTGSGNAPAVALAPPDMLISLGVAGTTFQLIDVSNAIAGQTAANISVVATGNIAATDVQAALQELDTEKLAKAGGTMTGNLELGDGIVIVFEGATDDGFETTLTVADPTADRTITLPNETGTVVTTGSSGVVTSTMITDGTIVNADISASAEIAVSKLANGTARQLLQTDVAGTGVEFTSNVDVPGTLDVTGAATFDSTAAVTGALTVAGVINADGKVKFPAGTANAPSFYNGTDTDTGLYFSAANEISVATGGTQRVVVNSSGNLGVNVASPGHNLDVYLSGRLNQLGQGGHGLLVGPGSNYGGFTYKSTGDIEISTAQTTKDIVFSDAVGGNERMRLTGDTGRLGIGTSSPTERLQVTDGTYSNFYIAPGYNSGTGTRIGVGGGEFLAFGGAPFSTERMRITSAGNVGIGTTSPQHLLDCASIGRFTGNTNSATSGAGIEIGYDSSNSIGFIQSYNRGSSAYLSTAVDGADIRLKIAAVEKVRISSAGNVGIGTTSPNYALDVALGIGITEGQALQWHNGSGSNSAQIYGDASDNLVFRNTSSNTERIRIDGSGRLLCGTSSAPTSTAVFAGRSDSGNAPVVRLDTKNAAPANGEQLGNLYFGSTSDTSFNSGARITARRDGGTWTANTSLPTRLEFSTTANGASTPTERMRIDSSGNVGIGITSPQTKFHSSGTTNGAQATFGISNSGLKISTFQKTDNDAGVTLDAQHSSNGTLRFATTGTERLRIDSSGNVGIGTTSPTSLGSGFREVIVSGNTEGAGLQLQDTDGNVKFGLFTSDLSGGAAFVRTITNHPLAFRTNNTERMRIDSSGKVGINETSPQNQLHVHDDTSYQGIYINGNGAPRVNFARSTTTTAEWSVGIDGTDGTKFAIAQAGNTAKLTVSTSGVVTVKNSSVGEIDALTSASTITPDFAASNNFSVTLGTNATLANPSNLTAGQSGVIAITQDGTGSRTLAYGSKFKFAGGTAPTLTTTASAVDILTYYVESTSRITAQVLLNVS